MIIALLALAFAMIIGGLLTAFFGWDIILVERGWTMVIAGSISAASGALLLGITAAISKLSRILAELARLQSGMKAETPAISQAPSGLSPAALSGGLLSDSTSGATDVMEQEEEEAPSPVRDKDRELPGRPETTEWAPPLASAPASETAPARAENAPTAKVPDFLLGRRFQEDRAEARTSEADASLYAAEPELEELEEERNTDADRDNVVKPAVWPETQAAPTEQDIAPEEPEEQHSATVIGTYNSGDNKYVMFSDGAIEAQTPRGVFRFQSLEELKEFIASGGESSSAAI